MSESKKVVTFDSDKKGIKRVVHIFQDIILPRSTPISTKQIHEQLISEGYDISRSQLGRTLNTYCSDFGVDRIDDTDEHGSIYWLSTVSSTRMSEVEVMLYISIVEHIGLETLIASLPKDAGTFLLQQLERMSTRVVTFKNVPQHRIHNFRENTRLICTHENKCDFATGVLNALRSAFNNSLDLEIMSGELAPDTVDVFTPISLYEKDGELYVTGFSQFQGGTNVNYCVSKITFAKCVDSTQALFNRPRR